jgi:hypothetical protein
MNNREIDRMVGAYLKRLNRELEGVARPRREQLVADIGEHIAAARAELGDPTPSDVSAMLDQIGRPEDIAAEAIDDEEIPLPAVSRRWREPLTIALLLVGGVVLAGAGWIAGVVLLWTSKIWTTRDKVIGTLVLPGGLLSAVLLVILPAPATASPCSALNAPLIGGALHSQDLATCTQSSLPFGVVGGDVLLVGLLVLPILTAFYLNYRRKTTTVHLFGRRLRIQRSGSVATR